VDVVVTRERGHNDVVAAWLPEGSSVNEVPLTDTHFLDNEEVLSALRASPNYGRYRVLVVTSARSALYVALARAALRPGGTVHTVGTATARALENEDVEVDFVGTAGSLDLAKDIEEGPVLILGAQAMRDELAVALGERGVEVTKLTCYETVPAQLSDDEVALLRAADVVFIGAPSAWGNAVAHVAERTWVVVPGTTTGDEVRHTHERVIEGWGPELRERLGSL